MLVSDGMKWDKSAQVVIVGYGLAGAVAAITAHDEGAEVLILEKQPSYTHWTNSSASGGGFIAPTDVEAAMRYMEALYKVEQDLWWTDRDIIRAWVEYANENKDWIDKLGGNSTVMMTMGMHKHLPGAEAMHLVGVPGRGVGMMKVINKAVQNRGIQIMYDTPAENLWTDLNGEVIGVRASLKDSMGSNQINVEASKAVILTCGGFEFNGQMKLNYLPVYPTYFQGTPANTGDGIRMAMEIGADLWHMNSVSAGISCKFPGYDSAFILLDFGCEDWIMYTYLGEPPPPESVGYLIVNKKGERFINEIIMGIKPHAAYYELTVYDCERLEYPRVPSYLIFDQRRMDAGRLALKFGGLTGPQQIYKWSLDNTKEVEKGWIIKAESAVDLASTLGMEPDVLERTIQTYNSYCKRGQDLDFGRNPEDLKSVNPPFYAVALWPAGPNTQGGPRRNSKSQVLDTKGKIISRLYSAGELGSIFGMIYPGGGSNLSECIAFGRIAGENAVKEMPRCQPTLGELGMY